MTSVALAHTHARSVLRKYIGVSITGALRGASEIPQRMVASGDSRPGRAALWSCDSESWRSGTLRSRRRSRDADSGQAGIVRRRRGVTAQGRHEFSGRLLDPVTGKEYSEFLNPFDVN